MLFLASLVNRTAIVFFYRRSVPAWVPRLSDGSLETLDVDPKLQDNSFEAKVSGDTLP